ncbi:MAG: hypothetical protein R2867_09450 [Caldilineaceae bacterium]
MQHELGHAAADWLAAMAATGQPVAATSGQANRVTTAIYLLDNVGLHDLDVRLNEDGLIDPSDAEGCPDPTVACHRGLAHRFRADADAVIDVLGQLNTALVDDDVDAAAPLATQAHEVQHDLSHAVEHWLEHTLNAESEHSEADASDAADTAHEPAAAGEDTEAEEHSHD